MLLRDKMYGLARGVQTCNLARGTDSVRDMEWVEEILDTISDADSSIDDLSCDLSNSNPTVLNLLETVWIFCVLRVKPK